MEIEQTCFDETNRVFEFFQLMDSILNKHFSNAINIFDSLTTFPFDEIDTFKKDIMQNAVLNINDIKLFLRNVGFSELVKKCMTLTTEIIFNKISEIIHDENEIVNNCKVTFSFLNNLQKNNIMSLELYKIDFVKKLLNNVEENFNFDLKVNYGLICKILFILRDDKTVQQCVLQEIQVKLEKIYCQLEKTFFDFYWVELILIYLDIILIVLEVQYLENIFHVADNKRNLLNTCDLKLLLNKIIHVVPDHVKSHINDCLKYCV